MLTRLDVSAVPQPFAVLLQTYFLIMTSEPGLHLERLQYSAVLLTSSWKMGNKTALIRLIAIVSCTYKLMGRCTCLCPAPLPCRLIHLSLSETGIV